MTDETIYADQPIYEIRTVDGASHYSAVDPLSAQKFEGSSFALVPTPASPIFQGGGLGQAREQIEAEHLTGLRVNLTQVAWIHVHR